MILNSGIPFLDHTYGSKKIKAGAIVPAAAAAAAEAAAIPAAGAAPAAAAIAAVAELAAVEAALQVGADLEVNQFEASQHLTRVHAQGHHNLAPHNAFPGAGQSPRHLLMQRIEGTV